MVYLFDVGLSLGTVTSLGPHIPAPLKVTLSGAGSGHRESYIVWGVGCHAERTMTSMIGRWA